MRNFKRMTDQRLQALQWDTEEGMRRLRMSAQPRTRAIRRSAIAAVAMLMVLLTASALAVGLKVSRQVEMKRAARKAVMQQYGLDETTIALFAERAAEHDGEWVVTYRTEMKYPMGEYTVRIQPDGSVQAAWSLETVKGAWGQQELAAFLTQKQTEFRQMQADESLSTPSTAEPLPESTPVPGARCSQAQALDAAQEALKQTFGFTQKGLNAFQTACSYENGTWFVTYSANEWHWPDGLLSEKAGEYTVTVDDASGRALEAVWSLADREHAACTREELGKAQVYDAQCMEWAEELRAEHEKVYSAYENVPGQLPAEELARLDGLMIAAGFDPARYNHVLPEPNELSYEQAVELAAQALQSEYGVSRETFDQSVLAYADLTQEAEGRQWYFWVQNQQLLCSWTVELDAQTGEILDLTTDSIASGNG